jgi:hypothetical protein
MKSEQEHLSDAIHEGMRKIANSITPLGVGGGQDAAGGAVESLTEACMGITSGLCRIADAINNLADAVSSDAERVIVAAKERGSKFGKQVVWPATKWPDTASQTCSSDQASADIRATNAEVLS